MNISDTQCKQQNSNINHLVLNQVEKEKKLQALFALGSYPLGGQLYKEIKHARSILSQVPNRKPLYKEDEL
ncbi:MAG: hypothetical protein PHW18_12075 [Sulfuricurvum sp.]|uniref:hypothetical protein n=1 Tax=Sulfuricurvum sp. TaxID=2025608 RepID=UPI002634D2F9|nr:hypothetical protein [Sulfuricurvum sp.]MDD2830302.1 hypothetical protein [Sulfuricurvum sp.]MDD4949172.1 hypothetical protein [Sulfuricurvum sp.]